MTEFRERSALFKFIYIILRVITFPIFLVLFIFMHPLWLLLLLLMIAGGAIYWPMSQGVKTEELLDWYQQKYVVVKKDVVKVAKEKGMTNLVPQSIVEEVEQAEDAESNDGVPLSENYNVKIMRDAKSTETKDILKKRSGFKKSAVSEVVEIEKNLEDMTDKEVLEESGTQGGGLANLLVMPHEEKTSENVEETAPTEEENVTVEENNVEAKEVNLKTENETGTDTKTETITNAIEETIETTQPELEPEEETNLMPKEIESQPIADEEDDDLELF